MQFTVLIEFLIPGLATTLLALALLPSGAVPQLPQGMPTGETATALLLLAVSYPVGILVNFPIFVALQQRIITPRARRGIVARYAKKGVNLAQLASQELGLKRPDNSGVISREELSGLFGLMSAAVFSKNSDRLNANHLYHEGLQRFARGMLPPLLMAIILVWRAQGPAWELLVALLGGFLLVSLALLGHSIRTEEDQIARFFIAFAAQREGDDSARPQQLVSSSKSKRHP